MAPPISESLTPEEQTTLQAVRDRHSTEAVAARARVSASTVTRAARGDALHRASLDAVRRAVAQLERGT